VPGLVGVNSFAFSLSDLSVGSGATVGFLSTLNDGTQGIFVGSSGATATRLACTGAPAPGTGGGRYFILLDNPTINSSGGAVFVANLIGGTSTSAIIRVPEPGSTGSAFTVLASIAWLARRKGSARACTRRS